MRTLKCVFLVLQRVRTIKYIGTPIYQTTTQIEREEVLMRRGDNVDVGVRDARMRRTHTTLSIYSIYARIARICVYIYMEYRREETNKLLS